MKLILALLTALPLLVQDDKVVIKFAPKEGDVLTTVEKSKMEMKVEAQGQEMEVSNKGSKKTVVTYVAVKDGKPTKKTEEFVEDVEEVLHPGMMEPTIKEKDLHGKTVTIMEKDGKTVIEGADDVDEKAKKKLKLDETYAHFYSDKAVGVGDSWEVKGEQLIKAMDDDDFNDGKMTFKVKEFKEVNKVRCAVLETKFELSGKSEQGFAITFKAEGELVVRLDRGYPVSLKLKGTVSMKGGGEDEEPAFKGEGPMTLETSSTLKE